MARQSITLTDPNDQWLKEQVESKEYASKSEVLNDLIRQARNQQKEIDWVRAKLEQADNGSFRIATRRRSFLSPKSESKCTTD